MQSTASDTFSFKIVEPLLAIKSVDDYNFLEFPYSESIPQLCTWRKFTFIIHTGLNLSQGVTHAKQYITSKCTKQKANVLIYHEILI